MQVQLKKPKNLGQKKQRLIEIFQKTFAEHDKHFEFLLDKMHLQKEDVLQAYLAYNLDLNYSNNIYESDSLRFSIYFLNFIEGSWHVDKQNFLKKVMLKYDFCDIVDLGFGVISPYILRLLEQRKDSKVTLVDFAESAIKFSNTYLCVNDHIANAKITLKNEDISNTNIGEYDAYFFLDSIEHVLNPTETLKKYVKLSRKDSFFIFSLPIADQVPSHFIEWKTEEEARIWISKCDLKIVEESIIRVNPEVDLFAEQLDFKAKGLLAVCRKSSYNVEV